MADYLILQYVEHIQLASGLMNIFDFSIASAARGGGKRL